MIVTLERIQKDLRLTHLPKMLTLRDYYTQGDLRHWDVLHNHVLRWLLLSYLVKDHLEALLDYDISRATAKRIIEQAAALDDGESVQVYIPPR